MLDVCLLLEGTYPYVAGGVSTWVHAFVSSMKDLRFGIVYIAPNPDPTRQFKYRLPPQVLYLKEIFLHDYDLKLTARRRPRAKDFDTIERFYDGLFHHDYQLFPNFVGLFQGPHACFDLNTFFGSKKIWKLLSQFYKKYGRGSSFIDFFWTFRGTHLPLLQVLQSEIPSAKIYHAVSTGYAGVLGAMAKKIHNGKFFLTEHGIYTHERRLEISQANWIFEHEKASYRAESEISFFKKWWISMFHFMSQLAYHDADRIYTLFEGNRTQQVLEGADPSKIQIIPNGINVEIFEKISRERKSEPHIGLMGRVVSIKDIKTFIQAAKIVYLKIPRARFYIMGPRDEEPDYEEECQLLIVALKMEDAITFTGRVDSKDYYKFLDLVVLTSLSEAQPYVILEANSCGIPVVATDVGACRDMLCGRTPEDRAIGISGIVTEVSNPEDTSNAILKLLGDSDIYEQCARAGRARVRRFYALDDLLSRYLNIYERNL